MATRRRPGAVAFAAYVALSVVAGAVAVLARPDIQDDHASYAFLSALYLVNAALVVTLTVHLPRHAVTRTLAAGVFLTAFSYGPERVARALDAGAVADAFANVGWLGGIPMLPLLFALFPDGWPQGWRRWVARADVAALATLVVASALLAWDTGQVVPAVGAACGVVLFVTGIGSGVRLGWRAVRRRERERGAIPFGALAVILVVVFAAGVPMTTLTFALLVNGPSMAIGYGVLRHHLFGVDVVVRRVAIAAATSLAVLALYVAAAYALASATGVDRAALVAALAPAIVAATLLGPAYRAVTRLADRRLYGDDPRTLFRDLAHDLAATSPDEVPAVVAARTRAGLRLPWAAVELDREGSLVAVAEDGVRQPGDVAPFDLVHAGTRVGRLLVQPRRGQPALSRRDESALAQIAAAASPAVSAARLVDELTESRERLVEGREAERRRLRRELHDGLSPSLAGMSLALGAARRSMGPVPDDAERLLANVQDEAARSWRVVRGILDDLRPPGLEELGLVGALEDRARQLFRPDDFVVDLVADALPPLPGAVEIAAYRIATEAMTNAARHSHGHHCHVEITANGRLDIVVTDDGSGVTAPPGIGVRSMTERAADLGGWVHVEPADGHGTVVHAALPLAMSP